MSFGAIGMWLRAFFLRERVEAELDKEMRLHLELETEALIREGMSPAHARRKALLTFGGVDRHKEDVRDARLTRAIEHILADIRLASRGFRRTPGFAVSVVALLALGIGVNAALFSVMYNLLIAPLPFADGSRMVRLQATGNGGQFLLDVPRRFAEQWAGLTQVASDVVVIDPRRFVYGDTAAEAPRRLEGTAIVPGVLAYTGARPLLGRDIGPADTAAGAPPVALLGHNFWLSEFGGRADVLGQTLSLDGRDHLIVGVTPPGFSIPFFESDADVFPALPSSDTTGKEALAKLRRGFGTEAGNRELATLWTRREHSSGLKLDVPTLKRQQDLVRPAVRQMVYVLVGAVAFILLIACANVANLLLARSWNRRRELAVRAAIGAGRGRLFQQAFVESFLLAVLGGAAAILVGQAVLKVIAALTPEGVFLHLASTGIQRAMLWATVGLAVATALLFGVGPALMASVNARLDGLKTGARSVTSSALTRRLRVALVVGEVALSVALLAGAGLLVRSLVAMQRADIGMDPKGVHSIFLRFPQSRFPRPEDRRDALRNIVTAVERIPGVRDVTFGLTLPPDFGVAVSGLAIDGRELQLPDTMRTFPWNAVAPDFFALAGIRVIRGRTFSSSASLDDGPAEVIVNESFARRFWPDGEALGRRVTLGKTPAAEVVGIVNDVHVPGVTRDWQKAQVYTTTSAAPARTSVIVRSDLRLHEIAKQLEDAVRAVSPRVVVGDVSNAEAYIAGWRTPQRFMLKLVGAFAALALFLAAVGLHAVIAYAVGQRLREFGVRLALGANPARVMRMIHEEGLRLAFAGVIIGVALALASTRLLQALLYGVSATDPVTLIAVTVLLLATAVAAAHIPARRAMHLNPVAILREE